MLIKTAFKAVFDLTESRFSFLVDTKWIHWQIESSGFVDVVGRDVIVACLSYSSIKTIADANFTAKHFRFR